MSRADACGMFWEDAPVVKTRGNGPAPKPTAHLVQAPEGGLGFVPSPSPKTVVPCLTDFKAPRPQAIMDIECYRNYFLVMFMRLSDNKVIYFEMDDGENHLDIQMISSIIKKYEIITFNGNNYDLPILKLALKGATCAELKHANDIIIKSNLSGYQFEKQHGLTGGLQGLSHIDLIELAPGMVSLKIYAGRLDVEELQDLPIDEGSYIETNDQEVIRLYCQKDLRSTKRLFIDLLPQIALRRRLSNQYRIDLRSKSDAQIAEEVLKQEIKRKLPKPVIEAQSFAYELPSFIQTDSPKIRDAISVVITTPFTVNHAGNIVMPKPIAELKIKINDATYQMGMGGLHSQESGVHHIQDDKHLIRNYDVASYYPSIILNCGLYPKHIGPDFLSEYQKIVRARLEAKDRGDKVTADTLKITINGSFGKLGSPYSILYAPELLVQVTVTGQLSLLMLIDQLEFNGITVISANTDGIFTKCPFEKEQLMISIIQEWEKLTGFNMDHKDYLAVYSRDVNNYIAIEPSGKVKTKGCFKQGSISKNPQNGICNLALIEFLKSGTPFEETIKNCSDITKFVSIRNVKGGAVKDKTYLGKAIRWYYATGIKGCITYKTNGNMVPKTEGAKPCMDLPEQFPDDIDYGWYIKECKEMVRGIGMRL